MQSEADEQNQNDNYGIIEVVDAPEEAEAELVANDASEIPPVSDEDDDGHDTEGMLGDEEEIMSDDGGDGEPPKRPGKCKRFFIGYWQRKKWTLPVTLLVLIAIIFAVPATRYPLLALGLKRQFSVVVMDSKTETPVSGAKVALDGKTAITDSKGKATLRAKVGKRGVEITKQYYKDFSENVFVGIGSGHNTANVELQATGRQVPVKVVNKITGKPVANAEVKVLDTEAKTDAKGQATIVLPTGSATQNAAITASGYNNLSGNVQVTSDAVKANTFQLTPSGRVYFLSNLSGNIDVVSTNLDGSGRKTVLAGTGSEDSNDTVLLASTDWKYLALLSKRDGGQDAKLFLINTATNQTTTLDASAATFTPVGWSGHRFIYVADRDNVQDWQSGQQAIKSFNADTGATATVDQTTASGTSEQNYAGQNFGYGSPSIIGDKIVYTKQWNGENISGKQNQIFSANTDGTNKQMLKSITLSGSSRNFFSFMYNPETLYIQSELYGDTGPASVYYSYNGENNTVTQSNTITDSTFQQDEQKRTTYLSSPSGNQTFWSEQRDGKNSLFVGDADGSNGKQIASLSDYQTYGWYTDKYLLVEKNGNELYALSPTGGTALKISDYDKSPQNFNGYGGL